MRHLTILMGVVAMGLATLANAVVVLPQDGSSLTRIHVQFTWHPVADAEGYQLGVVEDDGSPDPSCGSTTTALASIDTNRYVTRS